MASDDTPPAKRRIARSGPTALIASVVLLLWVAFTAWFGLGSNGTSSPTLGVVVALVLLVSLLVIPGLIVVVLVFAILALLFNPVPGKIMGALAVVLPIAATVIVWNVMGGFSLQFVSS